MVIRVCTVGMFICSLALPKVEAGHAGAPSDVNHANARTWSRSIGETFFELKQDEERVRIRLVGRQIMKGDELTQEIVQATVQKTGPAGATTYAFAIPFDQLRQVAGEYKSGKSGIDLAERLLEHKGELVRAPQAKFLSALICTKGVGVFAPEVWYGSTFGRQYEIPLAKYSRSILNSRPKDLGFPESGPDADIFAKLKRNYSVLSSSLNMPVSDFSELHRVRENLKQMRVELNAYQKTLTADSDPWIQVHTVSGWVTETIGKIDSFLK